MKTDNGWRIRWEKWDKVGPARTGVIGGRNQPPMTYDKAQAELARLRHFNAKAKGEFTFELEHVPVIMIIEDEDSFASIVKRERKNLWEWMSYKEVTELMKWTGYGPEDLMGREPPDEPLYKPESNRREIPDLWPEDLLAPIPNPSLLPGGRSVKAPVRKEVTTEFNIYRDEGGSSA